MPSDINPIEAARVFQALESGRLDSLFTAANTDYYEREGFESLRFGVGVPRESVWRLISAIRQSTGLLVLESAWGDFQVRVTPTAQLMEALYQLDREPVRSAFHKDQLPSDERWIVRDRQLVEEAVLIGIDKTFVAEPSAADISSTRNEVISAIYDETPPTSDAARVAERFYTAMRSLPRKGPERLDAEFLCGLHRLLRAGEADAGVVRTTDPAPDAAPGTPWTPAARIMAEIEAMDAYAESQDVPFVHPLVKTLGLAWWIRRVKPFDSYNYLVSRLASMAMALRYGYEVRGILDSGRELQVHVEAEGDLTRRLIRQLDIIAKSNDIGERELERRVSRFREVTERFAHLDLNHRQSLILDRALRSPDTLFTIKHHARTRQLGYETARQDFVKLVKAGLMEQRRQGKAFVFRISPGAEKKLLTPKA